jgi:hypothetical protein
MEIMALCTGDRIAIVHLPVAIRKEDTQIAWPNHSHAQISRISPIGAQID